jgi:hypothetical protein
MDKTLFENYSPLERINMLRDNCDKREEIGYMRKYTKEEIRDCKDQLAEVSITISDIANGRAEAMKGYKEQMKPYVEQQSNLLKKIKQKAEYITEDCYKIIDQQAGEVGYYNKDGILVEERPIRPEERQGRIVFDEEKNGTNN